MGWQQLLLILAIMVLLFGARRVGDIGGALGRSIREFKSEAAVDDAHASDAASEASEAAEASVGRDQSRD
jgi:sec-independent protein translocase protein TatA